MIDAIGVVVPARDEECELPGCLQALRVAAGQRGLPRVHLVVVLDACTDGSAAVVARQPGVQPVVVAHRNVGMARAAGFADVLQRERGTPPERLWLASTDADSRVPAYWLTGQLAHRAAGAEVVVGTVLVDDWSEHPADVPDRYAAGYRHEEGHPHVHGANLGMSAAAYLSAGGVPPLALAEDEALVAALRSHRIVRTATLPVHTSARRVARTRGGFGDYLRGLAG